MLVQATLTDGLSCAKLRANLAWLTIQLENPPPAMDRVKWAQNCLNNQIVIEDAYSQSLRPLELQIRTIPGGWVVV